MLFLTFLADPPGSWLYTFGLLAALEAPAAMALQQWWFLRGQGPSERRAVFGRLALAAWGLVFLRVAGLFATVVIPAGTPDALALLPPLDRATAAITVAVLIWALVYPLPELAKDLALLGLISLTVVLLAAAWLAWTLAVVAGATFYNGTIDETAWVIAIAILLAGGLWLLGQRRPAGWRAGMGLLGALLLAYAVHYLYPVARANAAGLVRWVELAVVPLAMVVLYRRALAWPAAGGMLDQGLPLSGPQPRPVWRQVAETLLVAAVVYFGLEFATGRFRVEGPSMQPNLFTGQYVLADRLAYRLGAPQRGDVVVVQPPIEPGHPFIKRLMGLPGDIVTVSQGSLWINGGQVNEPYILSAPTYNGSWHLGPDQFFVLGDNRNNSSDSHVWGPVHRSAIEGKALFVYWPPTQLRVVRQWAFAAP